MKWKDQVAIGLSFQDMLEWTFDRGECLQEKIYNKAFVKLQDRNTKIDYYSDCVVTLHGISVEGNDCEVVFNVESIE